MSSNTEVEYAPVEPSPPPPPPVISRLRGYEAGTATGVLGVNGCSQLRELLEALADSPQPVRAVLGEVPAEESAVLKQLLSWKRGEQSGEFELILPAESLVDGAQKLGVGAVKVHLRVGSALLETWFRHSVTREHALNASEKTEITGAIQRSVNRAVNTAIAVLATRKVQQRVATLVKQEYRQTVQVRAEQHAMRVQARAQMRNM